MTYWFDQQLGHNQSDGFLGYSQIFGHPQLCWRLCFDSVFPFCLFRFMTFSFVVVPVLPYPPKYHNIQTCSLRANVIYILYIYIVLFLQYCRWWKQPCMETPKFGPDPWHSKRVQPAVIGCEIISVGRMRDEDQAIPASWMFNMFGWGYRVCQPYPFWINYLYTCSSVLGWTRTDLSSNPMSTYYIL